MCTTNAIRVRHGTRGRNGRYTARERERGRSLTLFTWSLFLQEYHLQNALDAQRRLGSAKIRAVPIPDLYEDPHSQSIYPANIELPKQLIHLQRILTRQTTHVFFTTENFFLALQLESDEPEYDMDKADQEWFNEFGRVSCPKLTPLEYETIVDNLENASTRTLISLDEARTLLPTIDELHIKTVYEFWNERRTTRVYFLFLQGEGKAVELNISDFLKSRILTLSFGSERCFDRIFCFFSLSIFIRTNDWSHACWLNVISKKKKANIIPMWHFDDEWKKWPQER